MFLEEKNKFYSALITALFFALVILVCMSFGYDPPDPPIPEEGVEVNLGNSDLGSGDNPIPDASEAASKPAPSSASEQLITQHHEATTQMNSSPAKVANNNPTPTVNENPKEPEINKRALFSKTGGKSSSKGGSEGKTYGGGNQGKEGGDPNSQRYDGSPGKGGAGFSLAGRSARALPSPQTSSNKQGKIVVKIWVDANGNVTQTSAPEKGSTLTDAGLVQLSRNSAMKAKFSSSDAEVQTGTITYVFANN